MEKGEAGAPAPRGAHTAKKSKRAHISI